MKFITTYTTTAVIYYYYVHDCLTEKLGPVNLCLRNQTQMFSRHRGNISPVQFSFTQSKDVIYNHPTLTKDQY
jgi:hypothetical protein